MNKDQMNRQHNQLFRTVISLKKLHISCSFGHTLYAKIKGAIFK